MELYLRSPIIRLHGVMLSDNRTFKFTFYFQRLVRVKKHLLQDCVSQCNKNNREISVALRHVQTSLP